MIANPAAKRGHGREAAQHALRFFRYHLGAFALDVVYTSGPRQVAELSRAARGYKTVIALGGDGLVHEVVNALMAIPEAERPALGVLPVGSGNDYARTLGMSFKVDKAVEQLLDAREKPVDVGSCNGEYFDETVSFGLDAGIALDTVNMRKRIHLSGTPLYLASGANQLINHFDTYSFKATLDGGRELAGDMLMFTVQLGPFYGGGFPVCPDAELDDGLFDLCWADPVPLPVAALVFVKAKSARHIGHSAIHLERATSLRLEFDRRPPVQLDGEPHIADSYEIAMHRHALRVLVAGQDAKA